MYGMMENTGKTPAVKMTIDAVWTDRKASDPIPDLDSIKSQMHDRNPYEVPPNLPPDMVAGITKLMETLKRLAEPPEVVLPPNAVRTLPIIGRAAMGRDMRAKTEDRKIFYVVGRITYNSTWQDTTHTTDFCLMNEYGASFRDCPSGNSMN
jgi:hypothetical protein